mgnify:FL=1
MEKITKEEFLQRCADSETSTNVNALTKEIVRSEICIFDYYLKDSELRSVVAFDSEYLIIAGYKEEFEICG